MPKRPAKHRIEDRSRAKFKLILPDEWVFRDVTPDYGIDGEVEIFDKGGKSTSLSFLVQLKASESKSIDQRRRVTLRKEQWAYYQNRDTPVLIVKFDKVEDVFFCRWAGTVDTYHSKPEAKSFSFKLEDSNKWNKNTPNELQKDIARSRKLTSGSLSFPILVQLRLGDKTETSTPIAVLRSNLRAAFEAAYARLCLVQVDAQDFDVAVRVTRDEMTVTIGCYTGMSLHLGKFQNQEEFSRNFPRVVVEGIAIALGYFGQYGLASSLVLAADDELSTKTQSDVAVLLASFLLRAGHFEEALNYANGLFETAEDRQMEVIFRLAVMKAACHMSSTEQRSFEQYLRQILSRSIASGDELDIGTAHYNLGNYLRSIRKNSLAIHHYKLASHFALSYLSQEYYFSEIAGVLFGGGRYRMAADFYERALSIQRRDRTVPLYADALMFSGRYQEALDNFQEYLSSTDDPNPEWVLKVCVLEQLVTTFGFDVQDRKRIEASYCVIYDESASIEERVKSYKAAINLDALCPLAWFNYGIYYSSMQMERDSSAWCDAVFSFLIAALTQSNDIEAWSNAVLCAFNAKDMIQFIAPIIMCAFSINGERFLKTLNDNILRQGGAAAMTEMIDMVEQIALAAKLRQDQTITFRFLDDDGAVEELHTAH